MNFIWSRTSSNWDLDADVTDNSVETGINFAHITDADFRIDTATGYNPSTHGSYKYRVEHTLTGSNVPDTVYLQELQHVLEPSSGNYLLEERYGSADYDPQTGGYSNEVWDNGGDFTLVASSASPFVSVTMTLHLIRRGEVNQFYSVPEPGYHDLQIRHYPNGTPSGQVDVVGRAHIRGLFIENLKLECPFDPLEKTGTVNFDVVAYPNDWAPLSAISWQIWEDSGTESLLSGAPDSNGRVAQVSADWSGKYEGEYLIGFVGLDTSLIADVAGPGNTYAFNTELGVLYHRDCPCDKKTGEVSSTVSVPVGGSFGALNLTYQSFNACRGPNSLGYGWTSNGSALLTETFAGDIIYRDEGGRVLKWTEDNGTYTPVRPDNHTLVESLGNPGPPFRLTFRDQTTREFDANGKLTNETDRNGNTTTYTYTTGGDLETISDGRGGLLTYDYGARVDGQPISVRSGDPITGRLVQFGYSGSRLTSITNPAGEVTEFEYTNGRLSKQTEVRPTLGDRVVEHTYDDISGRKRHSEYYGLWREEYIAWPWFEFAGSNDGELIVGPIPAEGEFINGRGSYYVWDELGRTIGIERNRIGLLF